MYADISCRHWDIQVVSSLCFYVHVATKYLWGIKYISSYLFQIFRFKTVLIFSISEPIYLCVMTSGLLLDFRDSNNYKQNMNNYN